MVQASLKDNESFESLYRRFTKKYRQSNLAPQVKSKSHYEKPNTKRLVKRSALVGKKIRETKDHLQKTGQYEKYVDHRGRLKIKVHVK